MTVLVRVHFGEPPRHVAWQIAEAVNRGPLIWVFRIRTLWRVTWLGSRREGVSNHGHIPRRVFSLLLPHLDSVFHVASELFQAHSAIFVGIVFLPSWFEVFRHLIQLEKSIAILIVLPKRALRATVDPFLRDFAARTAATIHASRASHATAILHATAERIRSGPELFASDLTVGDSLARRDSIKHRLEHLRDVVSGDHVLSLGEHVKKLTWVAHATKLHAETSATAIAAVVASATHPATASSASEVTAATGASTTSTWTASAASRLGLRN